VCRGRQDIAGKQTGVSDRILPESGPGCPTGVPPGKSSHFGRNHPARTQNRLCILKPCCLAGNENIPALIRFLFRLFSAKREPFLQKIPFSVLAEGHFDKKENLLLAQDHTDTGPHRRRTTPAEKSSGHFLWYRRNTYMIKQEELCLHIPSMTKKYLRRNL